MTIYIGAKGQYVQQLQKALQAKGFSPGSVDGVFGNQTRKALIQYQLSAGLEPDGIAGSQTLASLGLKFDFPTVPTTRAQFKQLITAHPNYFGTLKGSPLKPVVAQAGNTDYEQLVCVGYQPQLGRIAAVVQIKQMSGYGGPACAAGSLEYVRFFIDWNNDGTWLDVGLTRFPAHDIPVTEPLYHAVFMPLAALEQPCKTPVLPRVRAILSWSDLPPIGNPEYVPPWGNALETTIQIQPRPPWMLEAVPGLSAGLIDLINMNIDETVQNQALIFGQETIASPSLTQLVKAYAKAKVPPLRYAANFIEQLVKTKSSNEIAAMSPMLEAQLGIQNLAALLEQWFKPGDGNQTYEELRCVGYDSERQSLSAIVRIKRQFGYGGDLCTSGSREYVSFWVWDEDGLAWSRLGAASVRVHDLPIPATGADYEVFLPVDFTRFQKPCVEGFTTLRIRAILAWNSPVTSPTQIPYWGGREEVMVEVKPGPEIATDMQMPFVDSVGDIPVCNIDQTTGYADGPGVITSGIAEDAPFGGTVMITGFFSNPPATLSGPKPNYRLSVRPHDPMLPDTANPWQPLANEFRVTVSTSIGGGVASQTYITQTTDADGYYTYQEVFGPSEWRLVTGRVLGRWETSTPHGVYEVRIEGKDALGSMVATGVVVCADGSTRQTVKVHLDNQRPTAELRITGVIRAGSGTTTPASDCDKFFVGDKLIGTYVATDQHFGQANLMLQPDPTPNPPAPVQSPTLLGVRSYDGGLNPYGEAGGSWELDTTNMRPCGYTLTLDVIDRTIVNSSTASHWRQPVTVGFCLEQPVP